MKLIAEGAYDAAGRRKYLSKAEGLEFLRKTVLLPRVEAVFCEFLYYTGCRISEALNLCRCDIDETMNVVLVRSLKKRRKQHIRRIPIPARITRRLVEASTSRADPLWPFSRTTAWRLVKAVMLQASLVGIHATPKGLRHAFGVRCALASIPLPIIQAWMGHADATTTSIYLAVRDEEERTLITRTW